jgi:DNA polymerase elongation subunit (family B)
MSNDILFHLLDLQSRDLRVEAEKEDIQEVVYESLSEEDDEVQSVDRTRTANKRGASRQFTIHLFGAMEDGRPLRCDVTGFRPFFYLRLPAAAEGRIGAATESIRTYLRAQRVPLEEVGMKRVQKHTFYGFTAGGRYRFLELSFPSLGLFRMVRNLFLDDTMRPSTRQPLDGPLRGQVIEVFEANLEPMLRFLHVQNIAPCGWVRIVDGRDSVADGEDGADGSDGADGGGLVIECDYEQIQPVAGTRVSAPFLTASWDIECFSMTGDFPLAKRTWKKTARDLADWLRGLSDEESATVMAAAIYLRVVAAVSETQEPPPGLPRGMTPVYGMWKKGVTVDAVRAAVQTRKVGAGLDRALEQGADSYEALVAVLEEWLGKTFAPWLTLVGDPVIQIGTTLTRGTADTTEQHLFVFPDCAALDGIVVHAFPTEREMILGWFAWMGERSPDILLGYNVFGFDEAYLWRRAEELGLVSEADADGVDGADGADGDGRAITGFTRLAALGCVMKLEEKFLSSSAMGDNRMWLWTTHGRLQIDLFHSIKRGYTLPSYKLDEVTKHFMSGKLKGREWDEKTEELVLTVAGAVKDMRAGRTIMLLDETGEGVSSKLEVVSVEGAVLRVRWRWDQEAWDTMEDATKWVVVKDDVGPQDIFRLHRGTAADRAVVGRYCLQDCNLVIDLYRKLETFNNAMSMANVCSVPISYIFTRGQGVKIESLIFKFCRAKDVVIPVLPAPSGAEGDTYEGAIVLDPEPGFYATSPIGVCDFASLYPSTIVSENISHDSLVWVKDFTDDGAWIADVWGSDAFDGCAGYAFTDIEYDILRPDPNDHRKQPVKIRCGRRVARYAKPLDGSKSTLPQITTWLLQARTAKKKEMKAEKDPERYALLDSEQLAYKLTGNSLYGQLGSGTFKIRLQALAASVTAYGRKQILFAKAAIEKFYGPGAKDPRCAASCMAKVVYGDSVSGDTPIILRNDIDGTVFIKRIDEFYNSETWEEYHTTKEYINMEENSFSVWTEMGFTPIKKLIRHRLAPEKKMFRIHTHTGVVDVTEDHSLVLPNGDVAKPSDVTVGIELLHNDLSHEIFAQLDEKCEITQDEAFVMGLFVADGSSDIYAYGDGKRKASWAINKADYGLLQQAKEKCPFETKILDTLESSGVYKLVPVGNIAGPAMRYRELFYNDHREKKVPSIILNAPLPIVHEFWRGFYAGDGDKDEHNYVRFDQKGKEIGAGLYIIARRLGYSVSINDRPSKDRVFRYTMTIHGQRKNPHSIKKIRELPHPGSEYVYDLETGNHHFGVGPGALIVHNTDSLFVQFNVKNPETGELLSGREARQATIDITDEAGHFITKALSPPHDFEFDKAFDPLLMFSKKRYAGNMYEENADDYVHKYMGIALKRRDNAPIVKTIYGGAMKMLLDKRDVAGAFRFVQEKCLELVRGGVSLGQLTVTKSLRDHYADPTRIAHKALADRIAERDPGNAPAAGDRIGYVYVCPPSGQEVSKLQGDRIETPAWIREHGLVPDYRHYIEHQLMNPISQAFALLLEQIPGFDVGLVRGCPPSTELDRFLAFREGVAARLLFDDALKCYRQDSERVARAAFVGLFRGASGSSGMIERGKIVTVTTEATTVTVEKQNTQKGAKTQTQGLLKQITTSTTIQATRQMTISAFLLDSEIAKRGQKQRRPSSKKSDKDKKEKE